jgi:predicted transcriptional regulator
MTTREALHELIEQLPDEQAEVARTWLEDLRDASDEDGPPLDAETLAALDRGLADVAAGRVKPLEQYERERNL